MFCVGATASIYPQGDFDNITLVGSIIMVGFYLIVAVFIRKYVKSNPKNPVAKEFYFSFGFSEVGMDEDDEDMLAVIKL